MTKVTKKDLFHAFYLCLFALALAEIFVLLFLHSHTATWWEEIPCFNAIYGFSSCAILVLGAKALGYWLKKEEDYYEKKVGEERGEKGGGMKIG
ncbi:MAG: hypothetical protein ACXQTW_02580 [Candidatus Methanospirareceae archaeon]